MLQADVRARSTSAPGHSLALLAILFAVAMLVQLPASAGGATGGAPQPGSGQAQGPTPFDRQGMWIWYVERSEAGSTARILARAKRDGIGTLYIKAGDGTSVWGQFSTGLLGALQQGGLDVCAWQFVYGSRPLAEAKVGAAAVAKGANCLVIDAEGTYEGRYAAAETYLRALRARIGSSFPLSLAGFPYVDYHPAFPYSVFFGPGGATYNQPQMYWKAIGTSVRAVYQHTYLFNRLWGHPIYPLGQTYESPGRGAIMRFRSFAASYGGQPSWWDWQETDPRTWGALGTAPAGPVPGYRPVVAQPVLRLGSRGDLVVWAQEHLLSAGQSRLAVTGIFGNRTYAAVRAFQGAHGLAGRRRDRHLDLERAARLQPGADARGRLGRRARLSPAARRISRASAPSRPRSASLPAKAYEIPPWPRP